jgi:hypothetical protein
MQYMYKNNQTFMEELDKFNQDYEKYKNRLKLIINEIPRTDYSYVGKTFLNFPIKQKSRKVFTYKKDNNNKDKLF